MNGWLPQRCVVCKRFLFYYRPPKDGERPQEINIKCRRCRIKQVLLLIRRTIDCGK